MNRIKRIIARAKRRKLTSSKKIKGFYNIAIERAFEKDLGITVEYLKDEGFYDLWINIKNKEKYKVYTYDANFKKWLYNVLDNTFELYDLYKMYGEASDLIFNDIDIIKIAQDISDLNNINREEILEYLEDDPITFLIDIFGETNILKKAYISIDKNNLFKHIITNVNINDIIEPEIQEITDTRTQNKFIIIKL